jgi:hypothetical protein
MSVSVAVAVAVRNTHASGGLSRAHAVTDDVGVL